MGSWSSTWATRKQMKYLEGRKKAGKWTGVSWLVGGSRSRWPWGSLPSQTILWSLNVNSHLLSYLVLKETMGNVAFSEHHRRSVLIKSHTLWFLYLTSCITSFLPSNLWQEQIPQAEADNKTITFSMCTATLRVSNTHQMDLLGPILNINIVRFCVKCVCDAFYETFSKFCAKEYVFPYGLLKERQMWSNPNPSHAASSFPFLLANYFRQRQILYQRVMEINTTTAQGHK